MPTDHPTPAPGPSPRPRLASLAQLGPLVRPYRLQMVVSFLLLCFGSAAMLVAPLALRNLVDHGFTANTRLARYFFAAVYRGGVLGGGVGRAHLYRQLARRARGRRPSAGHLPPHAAAVAGLFRDHADRRSALAALTADTTLVQTVIGSSVSMGLRSLFQFVGGLVMLAVTSVPLFAATVVLLILVVLPLVAVGRAVRRLSRESQDRVADSSAVAGEILNAIPTVQAFTKESDEAARFDQSVEAMLRLGDPAFPAARRC